MLTTDSYYFMQQALQEAQQAASKGEVPVGAVVVLDKQIIGRGHNLCRTLNDATAHAEMIALTAAYDNICSRYLQDCSLYVTLEPCVMCAGACYWSGLGEVIYGATDEKYGFERIGRQLLHPKTKLTQGILATECKLLLQDFFKKLR
jgi:tRNA(adenine34) deaminase